MTDRTVTVRLKADTAQYQSAMSSAAGSMSEFDKAQVDSQAQAAKWKTVGIASQVAGAAMAGGLLYAAKAAGAQAKAFRGLEAVYGSSADQMKAYAAEAEGIGLSMTDYSQSAIQLGAQLRNLGIDQTDLAGTTNDLIQKAADMNAVFGGGTAQALDAVSAALRKERDPIERYGISLTDVNIKAKMAAEGVDELQATLMLLDEQLRTSGTLGAAEREADSLAQQWERTTAALKNAAAALGEGLAPALASVFSAAADVLGVFNQLPGPVKSAAGAFGAVAAAALLIGPRLLNIKMQLTALNTQFGATAVSAGAAGASLSGLALTVSKFAGWAAIATVLWQVGQAIDSWVFGEQTTDLQALDQAMADFATRGSGSIARFGNELAPFGEAFNELAVAAGRLNGIDPGFANGLDLIFQALGGAGLGGLNAFNEDLGAMDQVLAELVSSGNAQEAANRIQALYATVDQSRFSLDDIIARFPAYSAALRDSAAASEDSAAASDADSAAKKRQAAAVDALTNSLRTLLGLNLGEMDAKAALIGQEKRLTAAVKENGAAVAGRNQKSQANQAALRSEAELIGQLAKATYDRVAAITGSEAQAERAANQLIRNRIGALRDAAVAAGMDAGEVRKLTKELLGIPKTATTKAKVEGGKDAQRDLKSQSDAAKLVDRTKATTKARADDAKGAAKDLKTQSDAAKLVDRTKATTKAQADDARGAAKDLKTQSDAAKVVTGTEATTDASSPGAPKATGELKKQSDAAKVVSSTPATTTTTAPGAVESTNQLYAARNAALAAEGTYTITLKTIKVTGYAKAVPEASGGYISGPGTGTSDSIPALLSNGEYVIRAAAVAKYGRGLMDRLNAGRYATGGSVPEWASRNMPSWVLPYVKQLGYEREWWERNAPRKPGSKQYIGPVWRDEPERRQGEKTDHWKDRHKAWEQEQKAIKKQWEDTVRREKLDRKWEGKRDKTASREQDAARREQEAADAKARQEAAAAKGREEWEAGIRAAMEKAEAERQGARQMLIAEAQDRVNTARAKAQTAFAEAEQRHQQLIAEKEAYVSRVKGNLLSGANLLGAFDFTQSARAVEQLAAAEENLGAARRALNEAGSPEARVAALERLAEAEEYVAEAARDAAEAQHTPENVLKAIRERANMATEYAAKVADLNRRGLSTAVIDDLATMDPTQAIDMLRAYSSMSQTQIAEINANQTRIEAAAGTLSSGLASRFDPGIAQAGRELWNAGISLNIAMQPVTISIDGRQIAEALIEYRRRSGDGRVTI